jgi:hypothetical protein
MITRKTVARLAVSVPLLALASTAVAQQGGDQAYVKKIQSGAPAQIVRDATIVRMANGQMQTLKQGTSDFTCMVMPNGTPMCADKNAVEWNQARMSHQPPPDKIGFIYMLAGDSGASNTDPYATKQEPGNHWVKTGPHVMIVGPGVKNMAGYPRTADANPKDAYVMWPGTPYEHLMLPVK